MIDFYHTRTREFPDGTPQTDNWSDASVADQPDGASNQSDNANDPPVTLPDGLLPVLMAAIQADAAEDEDYALVHQDKFYGALNAAHELYATFTPTGVDLTVDSKVDGTDPWHWRMELVGCGYGNRIQPMPHAAELVAIANRFEYRRGLLTEWYVNGPLGLEQGFTLAEPPDGREQDEPLVLDLTFVGDVSLKLADPQSLVLTTPDKLTNLLYRHLFATDATGKQLPIWLELSAADDTARQRVRIVVDDRDALYPITVDPTLQQAKLTASDGAASDQFGGSVAIYGDTAIVGAYQDDNAGGADAGSAYIFVRSGTTWTQQAKLTASDGAASDQFGLSVAIYGDTAVVGSWLDDNAGGTDAGSAYVFVRSGTTWTQQAKLTASDGAASDLFGVKLALYGDTVIVGAPLDDNTGGTDAGSAYIFLTTPTAPTNTGASAYPLGWACEAFHETLLNLRTGEKTLEVTDIAVSSPAGVLAFTRSYRQNKRSSYLFMGLGWTHNHAASLVKISGSPNTITVQMPNGGDMHFTESSPGSNHYISDAGSDAVVDYSTGTTKYTLTATDKTTYVFDSTGKLLTVNFPSNETWTYTYTSGKLTSVADAYSRQLQFAYISNTGQFNDGLLWRVGDQTASGLSTSTPTGNYVEFSYVPSKAIDISGTIINGAFGVLQGLRDILANTWTNSYYGQHTGETDVRFLNLLTRLHTPPVDTTGDGLDDGVITLETLSYTSQDTNLAINGDMELDSNWTNISGHAPTTNARSTTHVHTGTYARNVVGSGANQGIQGDAFAMLAGRAYVITAWVYVTVGAVKMTVTGQIDFDRISSGLNAWQKLEAYFVPSADTASKNLQFVCNGGAATFWVDTVSIVESTVTAITQNQGHPGTELAVNGTMELDSDWANISGAAPTTNAQSSAVVDSGTYSRHVVCSAANQGIQGDAFDMAAGQTYVVIARVYPVSGIVQMQVSGQTEFTRVTNLLNDWNTLMAIFTPGSALSAKNLQFIASGAAAEFYVDNVSITQVDLNASLSTAFAFQPGGSNITTETVDGAIGTHQFSNQVYGGLLDADGNLASQVLNFQYRPVNQTDPNGNITKLGWSTDGKQLLQVIDALGNQDNFAYNAGGATDNTLNYSLDAEGRKTQYTYGDTVNNPRLPTRVQVYDTDGTTILHWEEYTYDTKGRVLTQKIFDPTGTILQQEIDRAYGTSGNENGLLRTLTLIDLVTPANNAVTTYFYDASGRITKVTENSTFGACTSSYQVRDAAGKVIASLCNYNPGGSADPTTIAQALAIYDTTQPDQNKVTTHTYDSVGRLTSSTPDAQLANVNNAQVAQVKPVKPEQKYYDSKHRVIRIIQNYQADPAIPDPNVHDRNAFRHGPDNDLNLVTDLAYNNQNLLRMRIDPLGHVTLFGYSAAGRLIKVVQNASQPTYNNKSSSGDIALARYDRIASSSPDQDLITTTAYDKAGNLIQTTDAMGNVTLIAYDKLNRPIRVIRNASQPAYNIKADPTFAAYIPSVSMDQDLISVLQYDTKNRQRRTQDALGNWTLFGYDALGRVVKVIHNASQPTYDYTKDSTLAKYVPSSAPDRDLVQQTVYDPVKTKDVMYNSDALGRANWLGYDGQHRVVRSVINAQGTATDGKVHDPRASAYAANLNAADQDLIALTNYDSKGRVARTQDVLGNWTLYGFDSVDRQIVVIQNASNASYDASVDASLSRYAPATNPAPDQDVVMRTTYDAKGRVSTTVDPAGHLTRFTYDALDRRVKTIANFVTGIFNPVFPDQDLITSTAYDLSGHIVSAMDTRGTQTAFTYDKAGRRLTLTEAAGTVLARTGYTCYDKGGRILRVIQNYLADPTQPSPDARDILGNWLFNPGTHGTNNDQNLITTISVDKLGRATGIVDPVGNTRSSIFYKDGQIESDTDPMGFVTKYRYDLAGRQVLTAQGWQDNGEDPALWKWNGSLWSKSDGSTAISFGAANDRNVITLSEYDKAGRVTAMREARGNRTTYAYDLLNRRTSLTDPLSHQWSTAYANLNGMRQVTLTDPDSPANIVQQTLDRLGRLTSLQYLGETTPKQTPDVTLSYDKLGNRTAMSESDGANALRGTQYTYDQVSRLTQVGFDTNGDGAIDQTVSYQYDAGGLRTQLTLPGNLSVVYTYNVLGQLSGLTDWSSQATQFGYDGAGRPNSVQRSNAVNSTYAFDAAGHLTTIDHSASGNILGHYDYRNDARGNRTYVVETLAQVPSGSDIHNISYGYDALSRLTQAAYRPGTNPLATVYRQYDYSYDVAANRIQQILTLAGVPTTTPYSYDNANRLTSDGTHSYTYDNAGRMTSDSVNSYTWDKANRLLSMGSASYLYNGQGQRVQQTVGANITQYLLNVALGLETVLAATVGGNTTRYVHGPMGLHEQQDNAGAWLWMLPDALRSIRGNADSSAAVQESRVYSPYGELYATTGSSQTMFGFTSEPTDSNGLVNLRARYMNPALGQFVSLDLLETANRFAYAGSNPVMRVDPSGFMVIAGMGSVMPTSPQRNTVPWGNYSSSISSGSSWSQPIPSRAASVLAPITKSNSAPWGSYSSSVSSGRSWWVWRESDKVVTAFIQASDHSVLANQNQSILLGATQDGRIDLRSLCMNTQSLFGANIYYGDPSKNGAPCDTNPQSSSFKKSDPDQQKLLTLFYFDSNAQQTDQIGTILKVSPAKALEKFRTVYSRIPPGGTTSPRNDYLGATSAFTLSQIGDDQGRTPAFGRSDDNNIYFGGYMTTASITHEFGHQFDRYFKDTASMNAPRMGDSLNGFARKTTYNPVTKQWVPDNTEKENFADAYMTDILSGKGYLAPNGDNKEVLWNTTTNRIASFEAYIADLLKRSP